MTFWARCKGQLFDRVSRESCGYVSYMMKDIGGWLNAHRTDFNAVQVEFTFLCCIVHYTQCSGQAWVVSEQTKTILF